MSDTFTILNCGTHYDENNHDVIADLARNRMKGKETKDWMINPGPGSKASARLVAESQPFRVYGVVGRVLTGVDPSTALMGSARLYGDTAGLGMKLNVQRTLGLIRQRKPPAINMVGWSRGAITCLMIANELQADPALAATPLNAFLFDPVPGPKWGNPWNWLRENCVSVPPNIKDCAVIFMEDANTLSQRLLMAPLVDVFYPDPDGNLPTQFFKYPLPGPHCAAVEDTREFRQSRIIGQHLCHTFLMEHDTDLKDPQILRSPADVCNHYAALEVYLRTLAERGGVRFKEIENPVRDSGYFVNRHNLDQFQKAFPNFFPLRADQLQAQLAFIKAKAPMVYELFKTVKIGGSPKVNLIERQVAVHVGHRATIRSAPVSIGMRRF